MAGIVLVGAQWGDEGKGKITDLIADDFDYVARFQGGNNAGHTVIHGTLQLVFVDSITEALVGRLLVVIGNQRRASETDEACVRQSLHHAKIGFAIL